MKQEARGAREGVQLGQEGSDRGGQTARWQDAGDELTVGEDKFWNGPHLCPHPAVLFGHFQYFRHMTCNL